MCFPWVRLMSIAWVHGKETNPSFSLVRYTHLLASKHVYVSVWPINKLICVSFSDKDWNNLKRWACILVALRSTWLADDSSNQTEINKTIKEKGRRHAAIDKRTCVCVCECGGVCVRGLEELTTKMDGRLAFSCDWISRKNQLLQNAKRKYVVR